MRVTIASGKGGTGKTSLAAAFATLADGAVITDCNADASNLHLILKPNNIETYPFFGGIKAQIAGRSVRDGDCGEISNRVQGNMERTSGYALGWKEVI